MAQSHQTLSMSTSMSMSMSNRRPGVMESAQWPAHAPSLSVSEIRIPSQTMLLAVGWAVKSILLVSALSIKDVMLFLTLIHAGMWKPDKLS
ncbi:hypothetical protein ACLOJK_006111 [Asimina triloba]